MLSVLIPVYNYSVVSLVDAIHQQIMALKVPFQILVIDDCSSNQYQATNRSISGKNNVIYEELSVNIGRSKIRNLLAAKADYNWILFLDCDVMPLNDTFIKQYLDVLNSDQIFCGGLAYSEQPPQDELKYFHWFYGTQREIRPASLRNRSPFQSFLSSNFLIHKAAFEQIFFDEELIGYGHEDTLFGIACKRKKLRIMHLNNPVIHLGLDDFPEFIEKRLRSIDNLIDMLRNHPLAEDIYDHVHLLKTGEKLKKLKLGAMTEKSLHLLRTVMLKNLKSKHPNLKVFDLYRLQYYLLRTKNQGKIEHPNF